MSSFVFWMLIFFALETAAKIIVLAIGSIPQRTNFTIAVDILILSGFMAWGIMVYQ